MENLKMLYTNYRLCENLCDAADSAWEQDPENEELEAAFDRSYEMQHEAQNALINGIVSFTSGRIDAVTARKMLGSKREELESLMSLI